MKRDSHFMTQCGEGSQNDYYRPLLLTSTTFTWNSSFPLNLINSWADLEQCFHDKFYTPQPDISVSYLMNSKQSTKEPVINFLERLRRIRSKCYVQFLESEYASIVVWNMIAQLQERLLIQDYVDLA